MEHNGGVQDAAEVTDIPASSVPKGGKKEETFRVGTLVYTKLGLMYLFIWLLWGDFCFHIMEFAMPGVLSVNIKGMGASNTITALFITTIPAFLNATVNPVISFKSDRMRTKWGRRIPILFIATPPITLFLIAIGYSREIGGWLQHTVGGLVGTSPTSMTLGFLGFAIIGFQFFNMFTSSVFYYLFNDVVPETHLARCMSLFRVVGSLASSAYSFFVLKYAQTHMQAILLGAALLYFVAFMVMCFTVKEGEYPPPSPLIGNKTGLIAQIRTYAVECFTHKYYWYFYLTNTFYSGMGAIGAFGLLFSMSLGLDLGIIGKIGGIAGIISTILLYPAGMISDKYHALRTMLVAAAATILVSSVSLMWLFIPDPSYKLVLTVSIVTGIIGLPFGTLYNAASMPMYMRLLPKDRYGQFGSADAIIRSVALIIFSLLAGKYLDFFKSYYHGNEFYYRWIPVWTISFQIMSLFFLWKLYQEWKRLGGDKDFVPPP